MKTNNSYLALLCFAGLVLNCASAFSQTHLPPVARNDSVAVIQPYVDTINVTANDSSPSGDSFCITKVYGSPFFKMLNCNQIVFESDSSSFGNDTAWYVVCNNNGLSLCDTALLVASVVRHYTPMMLDNSRWEKYEEQGNCDNGGYSETWTYFWTTVDTSINNSLYKMLWSRLDSRSTSCHGDYNVVHGEVLKAGYIRQDIISKKIYLLSIYSITPNLLYDFNVLIGDTLANNGSIISYVTSFDYLELNGSFYRRINIQNLYNYLGGWFNVPSSWIEGIGSTLGPITPFLPYGSVMELKCFSTNGQTIYPSYSNDTCAYVPVGINEAPNIQTSIHPNPTTGLCTLQLSENKENVCASISDLLGREIFHLFHNQTGSTFNFDISSISSGVYFIRVKDGKGHLGTMKLVKE